jgi:hypothetical protein
MEFPALRGRSILVVEDEMLIGIDIRTALEEAGAFVFGTRLSWSNMTVWPEQSRPGRRRQHGAVCAIDHTGHFVREL